VFEVMKREKALIRFFVQHWFDVLIYQPISDVHGRFVFRDALFHDLLLLLQHVM
jgi:hypothetical protein